MPDQQNNLKNIFQHDQQTWISVFKNYITNLQGLISKGNKSPNFSIYRTPFDAMQASPWADKEDIQDSGRADLYLHILYMKSEEKTLTRNYNAQELELFCHNRFYGPLVIAYNLSKPPFDLVSFRLKDLDTIQEINRNFQNKSIKDDFVPECLLNCLYLNYNLQILYLQEDRFVFYMFMYKTTWCPT